MIRLSAYITGFTALLLPVMLYFFYIRGFGFPDGYISELQRAEKILYRIIEIPGIITACCLFYFGKKKEGRKIILFVFLYFALILLVVLLDYYFRLHLDHGQGG